MYAVSDKRESESNAKRRSQERRARSCLHVNRPSPQRTEKRTPILSENGLGIGRYDTAGQGFTTVTAPGCHAVVQVEGLYVDRSSPEPRVVPAGSLALFRPDRDYTTGDEVGTPAASLVFSFDSELLSRDEFRGFASVFRDQDGAALLHTKAPFAVRARLALIAASCSSSFVESQELALEISQHLARHSEHQTRGSSARRNPATIRARRALADSVLEAIARDPAQAWSLGKLAAEVHSSPFHLSRIVRDLTGWSIGELLVRGRVIKAAALLEQTDWSTDLVAMNCGYSHRGRLGVVFGQAFGASMSEYRRQCREKASRARSFV